MLTENSTACGVAGPPQGAATSSSLSRAARSAGAASSAMPCGRYSSRCVLATPKKSALSRDSARWGMRGKGRVKGKVPVRGSAMSALNVLPAPYSVPLGSTTR